MRHRYGTTLVVCVLAWSTVGTASAASASGREPVRAQIFATNNTAIISDPPVIAKCAGESLPEGETVRVRLVQADAEARKVSFERA